MARVIKESAGAVIAWKESANGTPLLWMDADLKRLLLGAIVMVPSMPTADPHNVGQLWANAGVLTVSAG